MPVTVRRRRVMRLRLRRQMIVIPRKAGRGVGRWKRRRFMKSSFLTNNRPSRLINSRLRRRFWSKLTRLGWGR